MKATLKGVDLLFRQNTIKEPVYTPNLKKKTVLVYSPVKKRCEVFCKRNSNQTEFSYLPVSIEKSLRNILETNKAVVCVVFFALDIRLIKQAVLMHDMVKNGYTTWVYGKQLAFSFE